MIEAITALAFLLGVSVLAITQKSAILYMLTAGLSLITGLAWFNIHGTDLALTISLILIVYSIVSIMAALRCLFSSRPPEESGE